MDQQNILPIKDWEKLPISVYKLVLTEVKDRFDDQSKEEGTVTERSIKCLVSYVSFLSIALGLVASKVNNHYCILLIFGCLSILNVYWLYDIIKGRQSFYKGLHVKDILNTDFDKDNSVLNDDEKERLMYNNIIVQIQSQNNRKRMINKDRAQKYNRAFLLTISLVVIISAYVGYVMIKGL